jgi:glycosyltransferase involved in cell wall biosynthesis
VIASPRSKRKIVDLLRRESVDLVHVSLSFSTLLDLGLPELCHELGLPVVATFHVPYDSRFSLWQGISSALYRLYAQSLASYDRVIIFSEQQKALLIDYGVPEGIVEVIPNGVDVRKYSPGSPRRREEGRPLVIGYLGRLDPEKNVESLLRAVQDADLSANWHALIIGAGAERRRLQRRFKDERVTFTGQVSDEQRRIELLQGLDIFVLPSSVEGLSLSLLEAMACGIPCVATDVGGDGEALRGAGLLIDPRQIEPQLQLAIRTLADFPDFRSELGRKVRQRAVERFNLATNLDRLVSLYSRLRGSRLGEAVS